MINNEKAHFYLDEKLIGLWKNGRKRLEIKEDGSLFKGTVDNHYELSNNGNTLTVGSASVYYRVIPGGTALVGLWKDAAENEVIEYRADGFYHLTFAKERIAYFGNWKATETHFDSIEFNALVNSHGRFLYWRSYQFKAYRTPYKIQENKLIFKNAEGSETIYEKVIVSQQ